MKTILPISAGWMLKGFDEGEYDIDAICRCDYPCRDWLPVNVPGDVHTTLIQNGIIKDPSYEYNAVFCGWVEKKHWVYRTLFDVAKETLQSDMLQLIFEGLDTYASVYLNGEKLGNYQNMFIEHSIDVTGKVKRGENVLVVEFFPLSRMADKELPEGFWINYSTERAYARKAAYSFGWDWTPRMITVGIWKPVALIAYDRAKLKSVQIKTLSIDRENRKAGLEIKIDSVGFKKSRLTYLVSMTGADGTNRVIESDRSVFSFAVEDVRLWWTSDMGDPHLYRIEVTLLSDGIAVDRHTCRYGIRTIRLKQKAEDGSNRFLFELNGVPIFAKGANWVPMSHFPGAMIDGQYTRLLELTRQANMNMLSVWGGGIYEKNIFYEECDRLGILVWQYFMFACGEYPDYDPKFVQTVHEEILKVVKRLRNYACIAIWVGNVEGQMISEKIGLPRPMFGKKLFEKDMAEWLSVLDDTRFYMSSSPIGGEMANSMEEGDRHNWDIWFSDIPYTAYSKDNTLFASEYGIHAAPAKVTVEKYLECADPDPESYLFKYINKDQDLSRMYYLMDTHAHIPANLDEYIDYSMLVQAEGLKYGSEHFRRNFPQTSGALIWQLNDCCPVHSWSIIDVDLIPKAAYYYTKRFFAPILISLEEIDAYAAGVWIVNNTRKTYRGMVNVTVKDFFGNQYFREEIPVSIAPNVSTMVRKVVVGGRFYPNVIIPDRHRNFYVRAVGEGLSATIRFFGSFPEITFPKAVLSIVHWDDETIVVSSDRFARFVKIDGELMGLDINDNYFDVEAGESRRIQIRTYDGKPLGKRKLIMKAINSEEIVIHTGS